MGMRNTVATNHGRMVTQPAADFFVGGLNPCRSIVIGGTAAMFARLGFEPARKSLQSAALSFGHSLFWGNLSSHWLKPSLPLTKNPNGVFLSDRT